MSPSLDRVALPLVAVGFAGLLMALPTARLRRRAGAWPVVLRARQPVGQIVTGSLFTVELAGFGLWTGLYAWLGPAALGVWPPPRWLAWLGWTLVAAAFAIVATAQAQMGTSWRMGIVPEKTELVTHGLFRFTRNPIFSGVLAGFLGVVLVGPSPWSILGWAATAATVAAHVRLEERHLRATQGGAYRAYARRVGRFSPWLGRLRE